MELTPSFSPDVTEYTATTIESTVNISAQVSDSRAKGTLLYGGNEYPFANGSIDETFDISDGDNVFVIDIENGLETKTYILIVTKEQPPAPPSAKLTSLAVVGYDISPEFNADITNYTVSTTCEESVTITATAEDAEATIEFIDKDGQSHDSGVNIAINNNNDTSLLVNVKNGDEEKTYRIYVSDGCLG